MSLLYAQIAHSFGLNDVCDSLSTHAGALNTIRGATAPSRNCLSHANTVRDPAMAEELFWEVLRGLQRLQPKFGMGREVGGQLYGLGQTSPSESRRQVPYAP